jgi:hypothetical protein
MTERAFTSLKEKLTCPARKVDDCPQRSYRAEWPILRLHPFVGAEGNPFAESWRGVISRIDRGKISAWIHDFPDVSIFGSV